MSFSQVAVALFGIYFKMQTFVFMAVSGLTQGALPIMGFNYGAKNRERLLLTLKYSLFVAVGIMAAGCIIVEVFPAGLLRIFDASEEMIAIGVPALRILALGYVFAAVGMMLGTLFQAIGKGSYSLYISLLRQLVIIIPLAYLLSSVWGLVGVWISFPIAELVSIISSVLMLKYVSGRDPILRHEMPME